MIKKLLLFVRSLFFIFFNSSKERSFTPGLRLICLGVFFVYSSNYGQCSYPTFTTNQIDVDKTFCIDNTNSITVNSVAAQRYVVLNVISGFTYTFSVSNIWGTENGGSDLEYLGVFNNAAGNAYLVGSASNNNGATLTWKSTISGKVRILLLRGFSCTSTTSTATGTITMALNSLGNDIDSQASAGNNVWRGHIYNFTSGAPPGGSTSPLTPANTNPFDPTQYVGYYDVASETIPTTFNFGGDGACFPLYSNNLQLASIHTQQFAVRYRMRSDKTGCYLVTAKGDDGVRLYVDNVKIFDEWKEQGATTYESVMVYLDGDTDFVLDYYENGGVNEVSFTMTPFVPSSNTIVAPTPSGVCSGVTPGLINGSSYTYSGATINPTIKFQWETATSITGPWSNATGGSNATLEDYTPGSITTSGVVTRYYRRVVSAVASNATACTWPSNSISITTSASGTPIAPNSTAATNVSCSSFTANWNTVPTATSYLLDVSTVNTFATVVAGYNALNVGFVTSYNVTGLSIGNYFYRLRANNGCGNTTSAGYSGAITVSVANPTATISGGTTICQNASTPNITFTNPRSNAITVTYNINGGTSATINISANATATVAASTSTSGSFVYNLVSVVYQSAPTCSTTLSGSATITVTPTVGTPTTPAGGSAGICQGSAATSYTTSATNATSYNWTISGTGNTISGTGTTGTVTWAAGFSGNATISVTANGCNGPSIAATRTITVTPTVGTPTAPAGGSGTICQGSAATSYTTSASNATSYNWTVSGTGNTISGTGTTATVTWASGFTGVATISVTANGCNGPSVAGTRNITVVAPPLTPTASVTTQPTCAVSTGTIVVNSPQAGITYSIDGTTYSASGIFTSVGAGSYTLTAKNSSDCTTTMVGVPLQVLAPITKTWLGGQGSGPQRTDWSYGPNWDSVGIHDEVVPTSADCVIIPTTTNKPVISGTFATFHANSLSITGNGSLIVQKGNTLKVENAVKVDVNGILTFEDSAVLLQESTDDGINSGSINYIRSTPAPGIRQLDYVYWSTPVKGQTLEGVSQNLTTYDKYYAYNGSGSGWTSVSKSTVMIAGKGYIIRGPESWTNNARQVYTATFRGTPINGNVILNEGFVGGKNYLLGNPYPSALNADKLITDNPALKGTLYFWTHNTPLLINGVSKYKVDDYASYNLTGGVGTAAKTGIDNSDNNKNSPSGEIAAGQSFMASFKDAGTITFTNEMRLGGADNGQFFKPGKTSKTTATEKHRVWLNLTNTEGAFKQMLVGYIEGATNDYEGRYDGLSVNGNKYMDFYSVNNEDKLTIQGRALPFTDADIVPLGYSSTIAGDFNIAIDHADGVFENQPIYLEDKTSGKVHDLRNGNYTFTTEIGTFTDRFALRYTNKTLGTGDFENIENGLLVSVKYKTIKITSVKENIKEVTVFDINGKLLYNKKKIGSAELSITNLQAANQVLLVRVTLENDFTTTRKVIFQ